MFAAIFIFCALVDNVLSSERPNIVFILTDDQDIALGGLTPMKNALDLIANQGATLENFFVNTPVCCPSRSTILTGRYLHNHGVRNNSLEGNCAGLKFIKRQEPLSIGALLKSSGYDTFYAGKYLNEYGNESTGGLSRVPKGWDQWHGLEGNSKYYNYTLSVNGVRKHFKNYYFTDYIKNVAVDFLEARKNAKCPFFMFLSPPAPHAPFTPAPRHRGAFSYVKALRTPSFNYTPTSKHWLLQMKPQHLPEDVKILDNIQANRFETLLAVDEMIEKIVKKLDSMNVLNETYIMLTSDHGFHIGQFGQPWDKRQPYETDIRVPFLIRGPKIKRKKSFGFFAQSVDIAPTILDIAGENSRNDFMDGVSFFKQLLGKKRYDNGLLKDRHVFVEYFGEGNAKSIDPSCPYSGDDNLAECDKDNWCKCQDSRNNTYVCIRSKTDKFCNFFDAKNTIEYYNLSQDPYELNNIYTTLNASDLKTFQEKINAFRSCNGARCGHI